MLAAHSKEARPRRARGYRTTSLLIPLVPISSALLRSTITARPGQKHPIPDNRVAIRVAIFTPPSLNPLGTNRPGAAYESINDLLNRRLASGEALVADDLDRMVEDHPQPPVSRRHLDHLEPGALGAGSSTFTSPAAGLAEIPAADREGCQRVASPRGRYRRALSLLPGTAQGIPL